MKMKNLEIYNELVDEALEIDCRARKLEDRAKRLHKTANMIRELVDGSVGFIVDEYGTVVDTASVIPEITIRPAKRGGGYVVDFGEYGGAFQGLIGGLIGNDEIHQAIRVIAKVVYRKAKAYVKTMERPDDADAEEASSKVEACA